jgi:hypothetical protein
MMWSRPAKSQSMITQWSVQVRRHWGTGPSDRTFRGLNDAVNRLSCADSAASDAVRDIGVGLGSAGHALSDATNWFGDLLELFPRRQRERLGRWECSVDLAEGWLAGVTVQDRRVSGGVDGAELLRYRLHQHYDRCSALGMTAASEFALIVIDLGHGDDVDALTGQLANEQLNDVLVATFRSGETIALFEHGRAVVLCERTIALAELVRSLVDGLQSSMGTQASPHGWVEPLPLDRVHVWGLVDELTSGAGHSDCAIGSA